MTSLTKTITDNIETTLEAMTVIGGYDFAPGAVEQERANLIINNRYPFIEIAGPSGSVEQGHHSQGDLHTLEYVITYVNKMDDRTLTDDPLAKQAANVVANLHKALMADHTRGTNALMTTLREYGYANYDTDIGEHFEVYTVWEVRALIDSFDMTKKG